MPGAVNETHRRPLNPHLPRLIELQAIDLRIAEIKHQRRLIPDRLAAARAPLHSATEALKQAGASVEALTKERRTCERDLDAPKHLRRDVIQRDFEARDRIDAHAARLADGGVHRHGKSLRCA